MSCEESWVSTGKRVEVREARRLITVTHHNGESGVDNERKNRSEVKIHTTKEEEKRCSRIAQRAHWAEHTTG